MNCQIRLEAYLDSCLCKTLLVTPPPVQSKHNFDNRNTLFRTIGRQVFRLHTCFKSLHLTFKHLESSGCFDCTGAGVGTRIFGNPYKPLGFGPFRFFGTADRKLSKPLQNTRLLQNGTLCAAHRKLETIADPYKTLWFCDMGALALTVVHANLPKPL